MIFYLQDMFHSNTGRHRDDYPIKQLKESERENVNQIQSLRSLSIKKPSHLKILLKEISEQTKALFRPPHLKNTILTCMIQFGITASYYT